MITQCSKTAAETITEKYHPAGDAAGTQGREDFTLRIRCRPVVLLHLLPSLLHGRWRLFPPRSMVPGDRLQPVMTGVEGHRRLRWRSILGIESNSYPAAGSGPVAEQRRDLSVPWIFRDRGRAVVAEAEVHGRSGSTGFIPVREILADEFAGFLAARCERAQQQDQEKRNTKKTGSG